MVLAKSKTAVGLGNALMNDRFGKGKGHDMRRVEGIKRVGPDGQEYITTQKPEADWMKMRSITEQASLDEFLSTAELAGTDFTAEKINNVKIIHRDQKNPYLLSAAEERATVRKQNANRTRLTVPRRPQWDEKTTAAELDRREKESLMNWRRGLAELQENNDLLMTPFERNLEVWRQLWRVIERSDLVVQIVDARNPLLYRSEDLDHYVKEVDPKKNNLLLVNKSDMMTLKQRQAWAAYFKKAGINFRFFSAELAKVQNQSRGLNDGGLYDGLEDEMEITSEDEEIEVEAAERDSVSERKLAHGTRNMTLQEDEDEEDDEDGDESEHDGAGHDENAEDNGDWESDSSASSSSDSSPSQSPPGQDSTRILTTDELESLFLQYAPKLRGHSQKSTIGLVGYPNVGKSSTINALLGAKKVSVSATPGKTKHFQTLHLSDSVILCDCPGLVFPNFANTKAELVVNGVLPIDQMREYTGPAALVAQRIPQSFLEAIYGFKIPIRPLEEGGSGTPTGEEVLRAYAIARGFAATGHSGPDEPRASRYILKDYVKGKLLYCHPPPSDPPTDGKEFNRELYDAGHLPQRRRALLAAQEESLDDVDAASVTDAGSIVPLSKPSGQKTKDLDGRFFARGQGNAGHLNQPFHQKYSEQGLSSGKQLTGRKLKEMVAMEKDVNMQDLKMDGRKHFKGNKRRAKQVRENMSTY